MNKRLVLVIALFVVFYILWNMLLNSLGYGPKRPTPEPVEGATIEQMEEEQQNPGELVADGSRSGQTDAAIQEDQQVEVIEQTLTSLENDELYLELDNRGGIVAGAFLKNYYSTVKHEQRVQLISSVENYPGEVVLENGTSTIGRMFTVEKSGNQVVFTHSSADLTITKTYTLKEHFRLDYKVEVSNGSKPYYVVAAEGLQPILPDDKLKPSLLDFGAVSPKIMHMTWSEDGDHENKIVDKKMSDSFSAQLKKEHSVQWAGVKDTYFACVFVPQNPATNVYARKVPRYVGRDEEARLVPSVAIEGTDTTNGYFYLGPIRGEELTRAGFEVENLLTYGWAGMLSKWLFHPLAYFHDKTGNWGWSIIILTFLIRLILVPIMIPSLKSSFKMRAIQPKLDKLKQKYAGTDLETKQKLQTETFKLYKEEKVNPFSSCVTGLAQMPVFIAYFSLLRSSFDLRQADWLFWIHDLSIKDHTYIFPVIMGATMFLTTLAMPMPSTDPAQAKMMKFMPVLFSLMFLGMPAGLILYMITSNVFTLVQTYVVKWRFYKE